MKISIKVFFVILIFLSLSHIGLAQLGSLQKDTLTVKKTESKADSKEQNKKASDNMQTDKTGNNAGSIKQVKSARPDMNRARGARPPDIIRPSGSRIPKGVGRPGGAVRPGRG
jgi:hypothetical protein